MLTDAIEYNAGQLLQRFEIIKWLPEVQANKFFSQAYPAMRSLRNYIEHGHHIIDSPNYNPAQKREDFIITERHKAIGSVMITLIIELLPELVRLRNQLIKNTPLSITNFFHQQQVVSPRQNDTNISNSDATVSNLPANNSI